MNRRSFFQRVAGVVAGVVALPCLIKTKKVEGITRCPKEVTGIMTHRSNVYVIEWGKKNIYSVTPKRVDIINSVLKKLQK